MKKIKKMLAVVSAMAVCLISMTSFVSNAETDEYYDVVEETVEKEKFTRYTTSFYISGGPVKYVLWKEATDYFSLMDEEPETFYDNGKLVTWLGSELNVYMSEEPLKRPVFSGDGKTIIGYEDYYGFYGYETCYWGNAEGNITEHSQLTPLILSNYCLSEEDSAILEKYLSDNNIPYKRQGRYRISLDLDEKATLKETLNDYISMYTDIKENTGFRVEVDLLESGIGGTIENVVNVFPEKTLDGDANNDGQLTIADATAIVQFIGNADEYPLSEQGKINADYYNTGDGITGMDAVRIQETLTQSYEMQ